MDVLEDNKKKLKKLLTRKRNVRDWLMAGHVANVREGQEDVRKEEAETQKRLSRKAVEENKDEEVWSAKTQAIRNKLDGKKRDAKERWNRFAGTEESGGRGL